MGYSAYTYNYSYGYGGLNGGTGDGLYSDTYDYTTDKYIETMTFTAAAGYTVTLDSFNLAQYYGGYNQVAISLTGGSTPYSLTDTPLGGTGNFSTYTPDVTGTSLTLTITNLYDVGLNTIVYSETLQATAVPEPSTALLAAFAIGPVLAWSVRRRLARTA